MRRLISLFVLCAVLAACEQSTNPIIASAGPGGVSDGGGSGNGGGSGGTTTSLIVSPSRVEIGVASRVQLSTNVASETVLWSSNNPGVASVSTFGLVTGLSPGVATITARASTDSTLVGYALVVVTL
jgi:hypothetical protein